MKKGLNFRTIDAILKRKNGMAFESFSNFLLHYKNVDKTIPIAPIAKNTKPIPADFLRFSISLELLSLIFIIGYFLLPIKYISKPLELFPFIAKNPQSFGCFNPLAVASITVIW